VNAKSEFVIPVNFSDGCVVDTKRRFQAAVAASNFPARRPTRGSGIGSPGDMLGDMLLLVPLVDEIAGAHEAAEKRAIAMPNNGATLKFRG
jgi:hypothetical protein